VAAPTPEQLSLTTLRHSLNQLAQFATVHPAALPRMLLLEAVLQARLDHRDDAIAMMRAALAKARAQGMPYDEGLALRELGNMLQDRDMIQGAHDIFRRIGAFMDAAEAVELLATVAGGHRRGSAAMAALDKMRSVIREGSLASLAGRASVRKPSVTGRYSTRKPSTVPPAGAPALADGVTTTTKPRLPSLTPVARRSDSPGEVPSLIPTAASPPNGGGFDPSQNPLTC
jgi:hypothetical protein